MDVELPVVLKHAAVELRVRGPAADGLAVVLGPRSVGEDGGRRLAGVGRGLRKERGKGCERMNY